MVLLWDEKLLEKDVKEQVNRCTNKEFNTAFPLAKRKFEFIKSREGADHGVWYLAVLIGEIIMQQRFR